MFLLTIRLLIIDPHQAFRQSARDYLLASQLFKKVEAAADIERGIDLYEQISPDLVLVDEHLLAESPNFAKKLAKAKEANPHLEVLTLSLFKANFAQDNLTEKTIPNAKIDRETFADSLFQYLTCKMKASQENSSSREKGGR